MLITLIFRDQDKPGYRPGLWACIAVSLMNIIIVGICSISYYIDNKKADRGEKELESADVGDRLLIHVVQSLTIEQEGFQPGFRYTY